MLTHPAKLVQSLILAGLMTLAPTASPARSGTAPHLSPAASADNLLAADRALAKAAATRSAAAAIGAMLDDDVVMFIVPEPPLARGKAEAIELLEKAFGSNSTISWTPVRVGISADGMQGFSYGFASRASDAGPPALRKYLSYWVKRKDGWRLAAFKLVPRPEGAVSTALRAPALPKRMTGVTENPARVARYVTEIDQTERQFSDEAQAIGLGAAFRKYGSADAMNVGGDADFAYGNDQIAAGFGTDTTSPLRWAPSGVKVASSGDLGITFGYLERNGATPPGRLSKIPWFTVWRRASPGDPWRYVAE